MLVGVRNYSFPRGRHRAGSMNRMLRDALGQLDRTGNVRLDHYDRHQIAEATDSRDGQEADIANLE